MVKINGKEIYWNDLHFTFEDEIKEAVEYRDKLIVMFVISQRYKYDNVLCYNKGKMLIWRIKPVPEPIGGTAKAQYVGISTNNRECRLVDFFGRSFLVNTDNGNILSMKIVK